uniref:Uncharacterized protein n=1 Tax=Avena sativa TaxID=4498 RepID=A0ACD5WW32_AVESA
MGTAVGAVIEILSDDETEQVSVASKPPAADAFQWASSLLLDDLNGFGEGLDDSAMIQDFLSTLEGEKKTAAAAADDDDDDDCVILDGDPDNKPPVVAVKQEKVPGEKDGSEEELQVLGEKGEVACRDFPHPRHLCAKLPFRTGSHANYCTMCHCYVCDSPAPCPSWGKGTLPSDHCHATDKDEKWSKKRQLLKRKGLAPSNHATIKKKVLSSSTTPFPQQYTGHQVSVPQPFGPLGITVDQPFGPLGFTVNQPPAGRVPVASNFIQNQQVHPSVRTAQNVVQPVHVPKASAPTPKTSGKRSKRPAAAPTAYAPPIGYTLNRAIPNDVPWRPAPPHLLQTGQAAAGSNVQPGSNGQPGRNGAHGSNGAQGRDGAPGSNGAPGGAGGPGGAVTVVHGLPTQRSLAAPVQVRPTAHLQAAQNSVAHHQAAQNRAALLQAAQNRAAQLQASQNSVTHLQAAQNRVALLQAAQNRAAQLQAAQNRVSQLQAAQNRAAATGLQSLQYTVRTAQGTQRAQDPSAIQKSWQSALANLASDLGVSDYNMNPSQVFQQQSVATQSLQQSQLLAQAKTSQGGETRRGSTLATPQMRPSNGLHQPNGKSGGSVIAMPKTEGTQALCVLNSHSSLTPK